MRSWYYPKSDAILPDCKKIVSGHFAVKCRESAEENKVGARGPDPIVTSTMHVVVHLSFANQGTALRMRGRNLYLALADSIKLGRKELLRMRAYHDMGNETLLRVQLVSIQ